MDEMALREAVCRAAYQLWQRGLLAGDQGLLTAEWYRRRYLATPAGQRRAELTPQALALVDIGGQAIEPSDGLAAATWRPHRLAYQSRDELATADTGRTIEATALLTPPELWAAYRRQGQGMWLTLGRQQVPVVSAEDERDVQGAIQQHPAVLLPEEGLLAAGATLAEVANTLETLEQAARLERLATARPR
jgi:L-fuculose-phosphate aldolase